MWQREQNASSSEPGRDSVIFCVPMSNSEAHSPGLANGLWCDFALPSGGAGVSHSPLVDTVRASKRNAPRHTGSRHEFDIIEPFHSSKIFWWQVWHWPGLFWVFQYSSYGGGNTVASAVMYGAASGMRFGRSAVAASGCLARKPTSRQLTTNTPSLTNFTSGLL